MRFLSLEKDKRECFLVLDVGTEAVKALIFEKDGQERYILGSGLRYFDESRPFDDDKVILAAAEEALGRAGKTPKGLLLSFSPNILRSRVGTFEFNRQNRKQIICGREAKAITEFSLQEIKKEISRYFARSSGILPQDIQFIDNQILEIIIDGYEVPALSNYGGKKIEFRVLASFLPVNCLERADKISNHLNLKYQIISPVNNLRILGLDNAIFIDIGGDITQVCLIRNGKIAAIDGFEAGGSDFSRIISQTLGMRFQEARLFKERYSDGGLAHDSRERIEDILSPVLTKWHSALKLKLEAANDRLLSTFFLFGGGSRLIGIEELITDDGQKVKFLCLKDLKNIIDNTHRADSPQFINSMLLLYG